MIDDFASAAVVRVPVPAVKMSGTSLITGTVKDMADSQDGELIVNWVKANSVTAVLKLYDSPDNSTFTERTDVTGANGTTVNASATTCTHVPNLQRYVRVDYTASGADAAAYLCAVLIGTHVKHQPATTPVS